MTENDIAVLESLRDGYLEILSRDLSFLYQEDAMRSAFNNEINMLQFIIENIDNPKTIEDNPFFHKWIEDSIQKHAEMRSRELKTFVRLKKYVGRNNVK